MDTHSQLHSNMAMCSSNGMCMKIFHSAGDETATPSLPSSNHQKLFKLLKLVYLQSINESFKTMLKSIAKSCEQCQNSAGLYFDFAHQSLQNRSYLIMIWRLT